MTGATRRREQREKRAASEESIARGVERAVRPLRPKRTVPAAWLPERRPPGRGCRRRRCGEPGTAGSDGSSSSSKQPRVPSARPMVSSPAPPAAGPHLKAAGRSGRGTAMAPGGGIHFSRCLLPGLGSGQEGAGCQPHHPAPAGPQRRAARVRTEPGQRQSSNLGAREPKQLPPSTGII